MAYSDPLGGLGKGTERMDKRFWSGAIIVVTVAVAGAGALPTLLLRPSAEPIPFEATFAAASAVAKPEPKAELKPVPAAVPTPAPAPAADVAPTPPAASVPPLPSASAPVALQTPRQSERAAAAPPVAATPPAVAPTPPPEPAREAKAEPFPPVQPVGVASPSEATPDVPARIEKSRTILSKRAVRKWVRLARARAARVAKRNGNIRPAAYPIGEFLAWRR
jgi:hypothetical protein